MIASVTLCLTSEEVAELTGRKQPARQIQWLTDNAWLFQIGGDGLPKVARSYFEDRMGVKLKPRKRVRTEGLAVE